MVRYIIRRVLWAIVLMFAVTLVSYIIFFTIPTDPAKLVAGKAARPIDIERARHFLRLDEPRWYQYGNFLGRLTGVRWNREENTVWNFEFKWPSLGQSFATRQDINQLVGHAAPVTASLVIGGAIVWMMIALPLGILSALRPRSFIDRLTMIFVLVGISAHPVWIGLIFAFVFGYKLGWTPITGYCNAINPVGNCGGPVDWAYHLILPWFTFALLFAALYARMIRANVMETLNEDFVRTARAKGAPEWRVMRSHVLRNALLPVVTMLGMDISVALGGAIFTESVYSLPGLGRTLLQSLDQVDMPIMVGIVVFATMCIILINLFVDLLYAVIDPRIRLA
jgi:peptide/nickel transport system permease protein